MNFDFLLNSDFLVNVRESMKLNRLIRTQPPTATDLKITTGFLANVFFLELANTVCVVAVNKH